ncbi:MAG: D-alanyl-D-alanine carboxypeptidase, partial [Streptococcus sp.]
MSKRITAVLAIILAIVLGILGSFYLQQGQKESQNQKSHQTDSLKKAKKSPKELVTPRNKSAEEKQAVMEADSERMNSLGLYYDYANMSLNDTINAFLAEQGIDQSQVAFSYKNTRTNE